MSRKPKYGEKNARLKYYRQKHQPPRSLQELVGDDQKLMGFCPSYGQNELGIQASPLSPEDKEKYESRKEREKADKAQTIRFPKGNVKGARQKGAKRKPSTARTYTLPPDLPGPIMTVFSVNPSSPVPQLPTTQRATPDDGRVRPRLHPYHSLSYSMLPLPMNSRAPRGPTSAVPNPDYQPPQTATNALEHYTLSAAYPGPDFHVASQARNTSTLPPSPSSATTPSLQSDRGSPSTAQSSPLLGTWTERMASSTTPPSSYTAAQLETRRLSSSWGGAPYEDHLNTYQDPLARHSLRNGSSPASKKEHIDIPSIIPDTHMPGNTEADMHHHLHYHFPSYPRLDVRPHDSASIGAAGWTSTYQGRHSGPQHERATAGSGLFRHHQRHEQAENRGTWNAPGALGMGGPVCATLATFNYQSATNSFTSQSADYTRLNQPPATADLSVVAGYARDMVAPAGASHRVPQQNAFGVRAHNSHGSGRHVPTMTSPLHEYTVPVGSAIIGDKISASRVGPLNQHRLSAPTTNNKPQPARSTGTSTSGYSELAHALDNDYSIAPYANEASSLIIPPPMVPQIGSAMIGGPSRYEPATFASQAESTEWLACSKNGPSHSLLIPLLPYTDFARRQPAADDRFDMTRSAHSKYLPISK